jgi:hypothetical protein
VLPPLLYCGPLCSVRAGHAADVPRLQLPPTKSSSNTLGRLEAYDNLLRLSASAATCRLLHGVQPQCSSPPTPHPILHFEVEDRSSAANPAWLLLGC